MYIYSLRNHINAFHKIKFESNEKKYTWKTYCRVITTMESVNSNSSCQSSPSTPSKHLKCDTSFTINSENLEKLSSDAEFELQSSKASPVFIIERRNCSKSIVNENRMQTANHNSVDKMISGNLFNFGTTSIMNFSTKNYENNIKGLPETIDIPSSRYHLHGEYCGHLMVFHDDHIDYLDNGELHFSGRDGIVFPHRLGVTDVTPDKCDFLNDKQRYTSGKLESSSDSINVQEVNTSKDNNINDFTVLL